MQRLLDIFFSSLALLVLSPLLIPIAVILSLTGEREIFYVQKRIGLNSRPFNLFKFATMLKDSPNLGTGSVTMKNDPRVLPFGSFLRKTKINELPQLLNIFLGHMSVVGPRPQTPRCFSAFPANLRNSIVRVRPGLSGIGSIIFRNEEEILSDNNGSLEFYDNVIAPYKGLVEAWYVEHQTLGTYFAVIITTIYVVLRPNSHVYWSVFNGLPKPPAKLVHLLGYPI